MLLTVGKYMMAAALTLAAVTTVFMVIFFREKPEPVAAAEPITETTAEEAAEPEDYSQPWLDIPDPEPAPEAEETTTPVTPPSAVPPSAVSIPRTLTPSRTAMFLTWRTLSRSTRSIRIREP